MEQTAQRIAAGVNEENELRQLRSEVPGLRRSEASLRAKNALLYDLINGINEGIGILDEDQILIFCNPAYASILEVDPREIIGRRILEVVRARGRSVLADNAESRGSQNLEMLFVTPQGNTKEIHATITPRYDEMGNPCGAVTSLVDRTPRLRTLAVEASSGWNAQEVYADAAGTE